MNNTEFGICDTCGSDTNVNRKYYRYDIDCECCSGKHFEIVRHCVKCKPKPPKATKVVIKPIDK